MEALILSRGLDTNGQNARYVEAARKWGADSDVLRAFSIGRSDPAGVVGRFKTAAEKHGGLRIRSASRQVYDYLQFPMDIHWTRQSETLIRQLAEEADIIHLNNSEVAYRYFRLSKPTLLHHHGSLFRDNPKRLLDIARSKKWLQAVSTIDLQRPNPDVLHWLPSAYDVSELHEYAKAHRREPDGRVRIVHCPTNRALKHTTLLETAVRELQTDGLPVDLVIVEQRPWSESLEQKAKADIVFDQLMFGYGCNSIEAWCMGIPVVSGADGWTTKRMLSEWDGLPFYEANEKTLKGAIRQMVESADLRAEFAAAGHAHVRKYHDEKPALARLAELYAMAIRKYLTPRIPGKGETVTFRRKGNRTIYVGDDPVEFSEGQLRTDDPYVIDRLRTLAKRTSFGIEEVA